MSYATSIISGLELIGMVSGGYIGFKYGNFLKEECCKKFPTIDYYRKEYISPRFKNSKISENTMFNMFGTFLGIFGGYKLWFFSIPIMGGKTINDNPEEYDKIKKFLSKK